MILSIIIPAYNEEKTIKEIITKVKKVKLPKILEKEIIVVNDASTDESLNILRKIKDITIINHKRNLGKGASVIDGIDSSNGKIILIQDADLEYNPKDYPRLLTPLLEKKTDVVYGSRLKNFPLRITGSRKTPLISHYLGNKFLTFVTNILYGNGVSDMETCYKVFRREVLEGLDLKSDRFEIEPELTSKMLKKGIKIYEVPIKVKPRGYDEGKKINWKDGFIALWTLIKYKFID